MAEVDGVLKITTIRIKYEARIPKGSREKAERALQSHAEKCPAYQSVRGCIDVQWTAEFTEV